MSMTAGTVNTSFCFYTGKTNIAYLGAKPLDYLAHVTLHKMRRGIWGAVAKWVRALDWQPDRPRFESRCGNLLASEL